LPESHPGLPRQAPAARIAIAIAGIALVGITILRHELWRDELQAWQIARASHGFHSLVHNLRYEGHPILWFGLLYPLAHAHPGPGAMQLLQFVIASVTISVAAWRAPFTLLQKLLFVFGYFVLYEYGVLARSYGLGAMLLVVALALAATPNRRPWAVIGVLFGLIAMTSAFGSLVVIAMLAGLGVDEWLRYRSADPADAGTGAGLGTLVLGGAFAAAGLVLAYLEAARVPGNAGNYSHWRTNIDVGLGASSVAAVWRALVPIPALRRADWNTNILAERAAVVGLLGLALFLVVAWVLRDRPGSCVIWVAGVGVVVGFLYARIGTATASRHIGHIFLCLVAAMWLAPTMTTTRSRARSYPWSRARSAGQGAAPSSPRFTLTRSRLWTALLVVQVIGGLFATGLDLAYPFSNGRDAAQYIQRHHLEHLEIIGLPDEAASTVAGYLNRPIYYLAGARLGTYIVWDTARIQVQPVEAVLQSYTPAGPHAVLLVNAPFNDPNLHLRLLAHFDNGIVSDEHFWIYLGTVNAP
jgi:hypothetical protein